MSDGMTNLENRIAQFEALLEEMRAETREAHSALKHLQHQKKEIELLLRTESKKLVHDRVNEVVKTELEKIGPEIKNRTSLIYDKVGEQIDLIINLSLGKRFATRTGKEDLRPLFAERLGEVIREIIKEHSGDILL